MKTLRVAWLTFEALDKTARGLTSTRASLRYRLTIPSTGLEKLGCQSSIVYVGQSPNRRSILARLEGVNAVVVGKVMVEAAKIAREAPPLLQLVADIGARGPKLLADFSDNMSSDPHRGPVDRSLANIVDRVVASTPELAEVMRQQTPVPVDTVTDPVEGARGEPRLPLAVSSPAEPLALVWFGHWTNFRTLRLGWQQLAPLAAERPVSLVVISTPGAERESAVAAIHAEWRKTGSACQFRPWSVSAVFEALREADAVIIPSDPTDPQKAVKSPNRFCESVWAGRFVVAHPLPSYQVFAACGWVGADLAEGLRWMLDHPEEALARIRAGQSAVAASHSPEVVAQAWKSVIETAIG